MIGAIEVDLGAIRRNVARLRALVAPARLAIVVKADAYGHGLVRIARAAAPLVDALCVYRASEALALRAGGVSAPILILGPVEPVELPQALAAHAAVPVWSSGAYVRDLERAARAAGSPFTVHVKIETGLNRLGVSVDAAAAAILALRERPELRVGGAYTHLAAAEELESAYTHEQLRQFETALAPLASTRLPPKLTRHAAASAAAILYPNLRLDLVRAGIASYGLWPSAATRAAARGAIELEPALSYRSQLVAVRDVPAGSAVGYGCSFITERISRIGVLPLGYAEGIPRALSNRGAVAIDGRPAPIVGRVCMNMSFIDVTEIPTARPGSRVTLIGADGETRVAADDWANWAQTINYEIVARLPSAIPRVYVESPRPRSNDSPVSAIASSSAIVPS
ncbi:MAG: alanine racemase [Vulcanimicrobiaceae bacterium]